MPRNAHATELARLIDETLAIDPAGTVDRAVFEQLAMDSYDWAVGRGFSPGVPLIFEDAFDDDMRIAEQSPGSAPPALLRRWQAWAEEYPAFAAGHPKLEMLSIMSALSERVFALSWMTADEGVLQDWADHESPFPPPAFVASGGWIEPAVHSRLKALRVRTGGWLYMNEENAVVFVPEAEWQQIRARRKAAAEERERQRRAQKA